MAKSALLSPSVLFTVIALLVLAGSARGSRRQSAALQGSVSEKCYAKNLYNSLMFKCKWPQPRAYKSSEIIGELYTEGEYIKPCMTVLHRCDAHSGCCMQEEGMMCAPKETSVVRLDYKIRPKYSRSEKVITILARNHTACGCVDERQVIGEEQIALRVFQFDASPRAEEGGVADDQVAVY